MPPPFVPPGVNVSEVAGTLEALPDSFVQLLFLSVWQFSTFYEFLQLGRINKQLRAAVNQVLGYEPFLYPTTRSEIMVTSKFHDPCPPWAYLGVDHNNAIYDPPEGGLDEVYRISRERKRKLFKLAKKSYAHMVSQLAYNHSIRSLFGETPELTVRARGLTEISLNTTTPSKKKLLASNCLATITLGDNVIWSLNFDFPKSSDNAAFKQDIQNKLELLEGPAATVSPAVADWSRAPRHHAEMRLTFTLAHPFTQPAQLDVDKPCCVFCASQLLAMGRGEFVAAYARNKLAWYSFSPLVMFFKNIRLNFWGKETEEEFTRLSPQEKHYFLSEIVHCAQLEHEGGEEHYHYHKHLEEMERSGADRAWSEATATDDSAGPPEKKRK